jgi:DNA-directed RNA polymerase specialized sigma24 family protein
MTSSPDDVTRLLEAVRAGERGALDRLLPLVYDELRYFGGLTIRETPEILGVSPKTVEREWESARLWLRREISGGNPL